MRAFVRRARRNRGTRFPLPPPPGGGLSPLAFPPRQQRPGNTAPTGRNAVWAGERGVFHFTEVEGAFVDSSAWSAGNDISIIGERVVRTVAGLDRAATSLNNAGGNATSTPGSAWVPDSEPMRITARYRTRTNSTNRNGFCLVSPNSPQGALASVGVGTGFRPRAVVRVGNNSAVVAQMPAGNPRNDGEWVYQTTHFDPTEPTLRLQLFVDGDEDRVAGATSTSIIIWNPGDTLLALYVLENTLMAGDTDFAIFGPARNGGWYATEFETITNPGLFILGGAVAATQDGAVSQALQVQGSRVRGGPHTDFRVVVTAESVSPDFFDTNMGAQSDGGDIYVSLDAEGLVRLPTDLASFNRAGRQLTLWTALPRVATGENTTFYLWWNRKRGVELETFMLPGDVVSNIVGLTGGSVLTITGPAADSGALAINAQNQLVVGGAGVGAAGSDTGAFNLVETLASAANSPKISAFPAIVVVERVAPNVVEALPDFRPDDDDGGTDDETE